MFPLPTPTILIGPDTTENVTLAHFFERRGLFDDSDSDVSPDIDASDD